MERLLRTDVDRKVKKSHNYHVATISELKNIFLDSQHRRLGAIIAQEPALHVKHPRL